MDALNHLLAMPPYPWQKETWLSLVQLKGRDKLPHALIVSAQVGVGAEDFALALAQFVMCREPANGQVCAKCKSCLLLKTGNHPDLKVLVPEEKSDQLKVDQVRELNESLAQTSQQGAWKVAILNPAHAMNQSAANALLKNLEEPAESTLFILVSTEPQKILATIRSRCRQVSIPMPDAETSKRWLQNSGVKNVEQLLSQVGNAPLLALEWCNSDRLQDQDKIIRSVQGLISKKLTTIALAKQLAQYPPLDVMVILMHWLEGEIRRLSLAEARVNGMNHLFRLSDRLRQKRSMLESRANVNAGLLMDEVAFDLMAIAKIKGLLQVV